MHYLLRDCIRTKLFVEDVHAIAFVPLTESSSLVLLRSGDQLQLNQEPITVSFSAFESQRSSQMNATRVLKMLCIKLENLLRGLIHVSPTRSEGYGASYIEVVLSSQREPYYRRIHSVRQYGYLFRSSRLEGASITRPIVTLIGRITGVAKACEGECL